MSVRIYQLARQLDMDSKKVIRLLQERGLEVKSPSSTIPNIYADEFLKEFQQKGKKEEPKATANTSAEESPAAPKAKKEAATAEAAPTKEEAPVAPQPISTAPAITKTAPLIKKETRPISMAPRPSLLPKPAPKTPAAMSSSVGIVPEPKTTSFKPLQPRPALLSPRPTPLKAASSLAPKASPQIQTVPLSHLIPQAKAMVAPKINPMPSLIKRPQQPTTEVAEGEKKQVMVKPPLAVRDLATILNVKPFRLISELMEQGIFASIHQILEESVATKIASKYNVDLVFKHRTQPSEAPKQKTKEEEAIEESKFLEPRPPIVCILGHVDHGKTTLLDYIRKAHVADKEAGGITQHVGAYQVEYDGKKITFLDTPGHAAFSKIRQRGATVTDIAILVVAADDGFMPQTEEALKFAQKENVPVIVAINKIDAKGAHEDHIKQQMQKHGITSEDWGGETLCVGISALKGTNIPQLLELVLVQAEMMELKANPRGNAEGVIIESRLEVGRGATTTVIVNKGTLKPGDAIVCGPYYCKVRALLDENGNKVKQATPGTPVQILGWSGAPEAGANFKVAKNEKDARREAEETERQLKQEASTDSHKVKNIEELMAAIQSSTEKKKLRVIIRGDVHGSVEALTDCLLEIQSKKVDLEIVDAQVGQITQNDIHLAKASNAVIVGFNTRMENGVQASAKHHQIRIMQHNIIYELIDQVKDAMRELLDPEWYENKLGSAEIRKVFNLSKSQVAGCMVIAGKIVRDGLARLLRSGKVLAESKIQMLKRFKEDVTEVKSGYECGIELSNFSETYQEGDVIECYEMLSRLPDL